MPRQYVLREPEYLRKEVAFNVALLLSLSVKFDATSKGGVQVTVGLDGNNSSTLPDEKRRRYERVLEQIEQDVPLKEIRELQELIGEIEAEDERRRAFRSYRRQYREAMVEIANGIEKPSPMRFAELLETLRAHPLSPSTQATPRMLRSAFKPHPYLAGDEFIDAGFFHHLVASNFTDDQLVSRFVSSIKQRYNKERVAEDLFNDSVELPTPDFDEVSRLIFEGSTFVFTGKFCFGSRKACRNAVVKHGGLVGDNVTRETDYLVVASGWENTSPSSSKLQAFHIVRLKGCPCCLISEEQWAASLQETIPS